MSLKTTHIKQKKFTPHKISEFDFGISAETGHFYLQRNVGFKVYSELGPTIQPLLQKLNMIA